MGQFFPDRQEDGETDSFYSSSGGNISMGTDTPSMMSMTMAGDVLTSTLWGWRPSVREKHVYSVILAVCLLFINHTFAYQFTSFVLPALLTTLVISVSLLLPCLSSRDQYAHDLAACCKSILCFFYLCNHVGATANFILLRHPTLMFLRLSPGWKVNWYR